ncbi:MAG: FAD-dependent oxidoreductase [Candidatus Altiarchaeota archaeon]
MEVSILGGGIAGLSAGWALSDKNVSVTVIEKEKTLGGLARSFTRNGYTYDLGGHRFFTQNENLISTLKELLGENICVMPRKSAIYLKNRFFGYPPQMKEVLSKMPPHLSAKIVLSYLKAAVSSRIRPKADKSFEDWIVNRFGRSMYDFYFGPYTEKVWGTSPSEISADWAAQRITVVSLLDAVKNTLSNVEDGPRTYAREFYYPERGGIASISNALADRIREKSGKIRTDCSVTEVHVSGDRVDSIVCNGGEDELQPDYVVNSIPLTSLIRAIRPEVPDSVAEAASRLKYRSCVFVYISLDKPEISDNTWLYLPERNILANRINETNKFSRYNAPEGKSLLNVDLTCNKDDLLWDTPDDRLIGRCISDFERIGLLTEDDVDSAWVEREEHCYPLYTLDYRKNLDVVLDYLGGIRNLSTIGRNGLFRYNNMDHSLEMGLTAGQNIASTGESHIKYESVFNAV